MAVAMSPALAAVYALCCLMSASFVKRESGAPPHRPKLYRRTSVWLKIEDSGINSAYSGSLAADVPIEKKAACKQTAFLKGASVSQPRPFKGLSSKTQSFKDLLEQGQHALLGLVGLGQHGGGGLRDDL